MKTLREFIKKEVKRISEEGMKSYPIPPEIRNALENDLKLKPLVRFVATTKALISHKKYWLHDTSEGELAIQAMNRILTQPIPKSGEESGEEESSEEGGDTEMEPETGDEEEEPEA